MTTQELENRILAWKKAEEARVLADLRSGVYGGKGSIAKRDISLIQFEARRLFDEVEHLAFLLRDSERRILAELSGLSGVSVLKPDLFEDGKEGQSG